MLLGTPKSLPDQTRPLCILSKEVELCSNWRVPLWQTPNDVKYCQQLPTVQAGGGCSNCTQLMTLLPNGWRHMARKCTWQQQLVHCPRPSVQGSSLDLLCSQYNPMIIYVTHYTLPTFYVVKMLITLLYQNISEYRTLQALPITQ